MIIHKKKFWFNQSSPFEKIPFFYPNDSISTLGGHLQYLTKKNPFIWNPRSILTKFAHKCYSYNRGEFFFYYCNHTVQSCSVVVVTLDFKSTQKKTLQGTIMHSSDLHKKNEIFFNFHFRLNQVSRFWKKFAFHIFIYSSLLKIVWWWQQASISDVKTKYYCTRWQWM